MPSDSIVLLLCLLLISWGCNQGPVPITTGTDSCVYCKMTIMNNRYGGEIVTGKGKVLMFDSGECIRDYLHENSLPDGARVYLINYLEPSGFIPAESAILLISPAISSPMGGNLASIAASDSSRSEVQAMRGKKLTWNVFLHEAE